MLSVFSIGLRVTAIWSPTNYRRRAESVIFGRKRFSGFPAVPTALQSTGGIAKLFRLNLCPDLLAERGIFHGTSG